MANSGSQSPHQVQQAVSGNVPVPRMANFSQLPVKTPAAFSETNQSESAAYQERFEAITMVNLEDYCLPSYLKQFDHYEVFDRDRSYSKNTFQLPQRGSKRYKNHLYVINNKNLYVVAIPVNDEFEQLVDYCQCFNCRLSICNPLKYIWCPTCVQCIKSGPWYAKAEYIEQARKCKQEVGYKMKLNWFRIYELMVVILMVFMVWYKW